jgi:predicted membrane protein
LFLVYSGVQHILCCVFLLYLSSSCFLYIVVSNTYCVVLFVVFVFTICVGYHYMQETRRRQIQQTTQHNMCWTPLYTRNKTKTNTTKHTTQYVLDTTIYKKQDEDKHIVLCCLLYLSSSCFLYIMVSNTYCVVLFVVFVFVLFLVYSGVTNTTNNTTQYVLDTTIYKKQDEDKYNKQHNTICVGHHYIQETRRRQSSVTWYYFIILCYMVSHRYANT